MKVFLLVLLTSVASMAQGEFKYLRKGEPFPFDSGVAISERQYTFILRQQKIGQIDRRIETELSREPTINVKVIEVPVERKQKWYEKKFARIGIGAIALAVGYRIGSSK